MIFESAKYPVDPGCYQIKNKSGKVIYAGKAKNMIKHCKQSYNLKQVTDFNRVAVID